MTTGTEKVVDLFKAFRTQSIDYEELFGSLTKILSEDPHFSTQAIAALDNAQQQTPIPVTDFIQLRGQLENTAETFHQQEITPGTGESEATKIFSEEDQTQAPESLSPFDPTLMAAPETAEEPAASEAQPTATPAPAQSDYEDEATVIMPVPPKRPAKTESGEPPATAVDPHATLITTPEDKPDPVTTESQDEQATLIAAPESLPESQASSPPGDEDSPALEQKSPVKDAPAMKTANRATGLPLPLLAGAAGVLVLLVVVLVMLVWPGEESELPVAQEQPTEASPWGPAPTKETSAQATEPANESPLNESTLIEPETPTVAAESISDPVTDSLSEDAIAGDAEAASESASTTSAGAIAEEPTLANSQAPASDSPDQSIITEPAAAPPAVKDEAYYFAQIKQAVKDADLGPAEATNSATYFLVELIKLNQQSDFITDARTLIAQKHLELAKVARQNNQWDSAQQHLDDAFKVRLPDSYMPE